MPKHETLTSSDSDSDNERRIKAKLRKEDSRKRKAQGPSSSSGPKKTATEVTAANVITVDGEEKISLGKKKFVSVRTFKNMIFVDIREFYEKDGELKPGKKGISLQAEQWQTLKQNIDLIDEKVQELC